MYTHIPLNSIMLNSRSVRIWDTVGEDQTLKGEYKALSGRVLVHSIVAGPTYPNITIATT